MQSAYQTDWQSVWRHLNNPCAQMEAAQLLLGRDQTWTAAVLHRDRWHHQTRQSIASNLEDGQ